MNTATNADLLDMTLDDLADLPAFKPFPEGAHRVKIRWETKEINKKPAHILHLDWLEAIELANPDAELPKVGDSTQVSYILIKNDGTKNETSEGFLKETLKMLAKSFGGSTVREIMERSNNMECLVTTKVKVNRDNGTENTQLVTIAGI